MQTYTIKNQNELDKFKDRYGYYINGNAEFEFTAIFTGRLLIDGYLYIKAGESIEAGQSIEAGGYIKAGWSIKAGGYIKAGGSYGISAGLSITCKTTLSFGLKAYAGICTWREIDDDEKTITCGKLVNGTIEYGILKETGLEEEKKETIIIGGNTYDKKEVEERLKDIKPISSNNNEKDN